MIDETTIAPNAAPELAARAPEQPRLAADPASLAREMGRAYQQMVAYYSKEMSPTKADAGPAIRAGEILSVCWRRRPSN